MLDVPRVGGRLHYRFHDPGGKWGVDLVEQLQEQDGDAMPKGSARGYWPHDLRGGAVFVDGGDGSDGGVPNWPPAELLGAQHEQ